MMSSNPKWLEWAQRLQALSQTGLAFTTNPFDIVRYKEIQEIAAEIFTGYTEVDQAVVLGIFQDQAGYTTPKVDSRGVIFQDGKILLVKELSDGAWTLPGGWVDVNEPPSLAVEREVREEAGYVVKASKLLAVYDRNQHGHPPYPFHAYKLFFLCDLMEKTEADALETSDASFYSEDSIPPLSLTRTTMEEVSRMFEHHRHPDWPTDFD
jgi:ADP-ribose pyrophosphatase YjhB (NUDIX family)